MNIERLIDCLPVIGYGLLGVFSLIGIIALLVVAMTKLFPMKNDENGCDGK